MHSTYWVRAYRVGTVAGEDLFVLFSPLPPGISLAGEDLFVHFSNIVGGNALVQDGQVEFGLTLTLTLTLILALTLTLTLTLTRSSSSRCTTSARLA